MKMLCKKANRYGGQKRAFGDEVEVSRHDVRLVSVLGWFVPFEEAVRAEPVKAVPKPRAIAVARNPDFAEFLMPIPEAPAAPAELPIEEAVKEKPKRVYQRRDMTPES